MPVLILCVSLPILLAAYLAASSFRSGDRLKKWCAVGVLALLVLPVLMAVFGWTVLAAMDVTWRAGVKTGCGLCYTVGVLLLLLWAGKGMIGQFCVSGNELVNMLIGCVVTVLVALVCFFVGMLGILLSTAFGSDHVTEWEGQLVVAHDDDREPDRRIITYHAYHGPLVRGISGLEEIEPPYYADGVKAKRQVSQELGMELPPSDVEFYEDTHGGFHGDGTTYIRLKFYDSGLPEDFWYCYGLWRSLPLPENLAGRVTQINEAAAGVLEVEHGYYYFRDRHSEAENDWDAAAIEGRYSYNFTLAVYDTDARTLHFLKLDT